MTIKKYQVLLPESPAVNETESGQIVVGITFLRKKLKDFLVKCRHL